MYPNGTKPPCLTPMDRARAVARKLKERGLPDCWENDVIALVWNEIDQAETQTRRHEHNLLTAEWLIGVVPAEVIQMAAEKLLSKQY